MQGDQLDNMRYWCSRKHDWEGVITTANERAIHEVTDVPTVETEDQINNTQE